MGRSFYLVLLISLTVRSASTPAQATPPPFCDCSDNILNCTDFASYQEALNCYSACWQTVGRDIHELDHNEDGIPCEALPGAPEPTTTLLPTVTPSATETLPPTATPLPIATLMPTASPTLPSVAEEPNIPPEEPGWFRIIEAIGAIGTGIGVIYAGIHFAWERCQKRRKSRRENQQSKPDSPAHA